MAASAAMLTRMNMTSIAPSSTGCVNFSLSIATKATMSGECAEYRAYAK
jgi:hypothetical protein